VSLPHEDPVLALFEHISTAEDLRRARLLYQAILDSLPDIVFVKSAGEDQRYLLANRLCAEAHGQTTTTMVGKRNEDIFPPDVAASLDTIDARVAAGHESVVFEEVVPILSKGRRFFHTTKTPIRGEHGRLLFLVGVARDVTEQKQAEEALERSREELRATRDDLLATIRKLSTPVLPIHDGVLVVPLVGHLDTERSAQFTEALLAGIQGHNAGTAIIDITGVDHVDTDVASHLMQAMRAASLLGTECVLVGIAPSIARTLVDIGIDFGALVTCRDLQAGVAHALAKRARETSDKTIR
jgi:anti-anti-sigma factor